MKLPAKDVDDFYLWALWRRRGGHPKDRPPGLRKRIPKLWQSEYLRRGFKPIPSPASPLGTFAQPGAWVSWAITATGWTPSGLADHAAAAGVRWVAVDATIDANISAFPAIAVACGAHAIKAGLWGQIHSAEVAAGHCRTAGAPFYIAQNEGMGQTEPDFPRLFRQWAALVELAVVAGPFDGLPNPLLDAPGWEAFTRPWLTSPILVEAYIAENPNGTPAAQTFQAVQRGFKAVAVVVEANEAHGWELVEYDQVGERPGGRAMSLYLLEAASPASRERFREWAVAA